MGELSTGMQFAWQMAAVEALASSHELIEPVHLLIGVCSVEKLFAPEIKERLQIPEDSVIEARTEWDELSALFGIAGAQPADLRRKLRVALGQGKCADQNRKEISRSDTSRALFKRAAALSKDRGVSKTGLRYLLSAMLEDEAGPVYLMLGGQGVSAADLRKAAMQPCAEGVIRLAGGPTASTPYLTKYGKDLTALAKDGKLHPCIGRREELLQVVR